MTIMEQNDPRETLDRLIAQRGDSYGAISRMLGRNAAYIQQFIKRGSPRRLDEQDRHILARYFGVDERELGGGAAARSGAEDISLAPGGAVPRSRAPAIAAGSGGSLARVPRLALGASAGAGMLDVDERPAGSVGFDAAWLRASGLRPESLSIIRVDGESMAPTLADGDDIMVDRADAAARLRDGIYVLRLDDALMVKRVAIVPRGVGAGGEGAGAGKGGGAGESVGGRAISVSSDNPHYPAWKDIDPRLIDIVGRVVWRGSRLA